MPWYFILTNLLFAAMVVGGIVGGHAWAVATQRRDWPGAERGVARSDARAATSPSPQIVPGLAVS